MMGYGSADSSERRIEAGKAQPSTPSKKTTAVRGVGPQIDMYEGRVPWKQVQAGDKDFIAAQNEWDAMPQKPAGIDENTWVFHNAMAAKRASGTATDSINNTTTNLLGNGSSGGSGSSTSASIPALKAYIDSLNGVDPFLEQIKALYSGYGNELNTQVAQAQQRGDAALAQLDAALAAQKNPYEALAMAQVPDAVNPMAQYMGATGANTAGVDALAQMLSQSNSGTQQAWKNMTDMLAASQAAANQGRVGDAAFVRAGFNEDLATQQRAIASQIAAAQLQAALGQANNRQTQKNSLIETLLGLAAKGQDVSSLLSTLVGAQ